MSGQVSVRLPLHRGTLQCLGCKLIGPHGACQTQNVGTSSFGTGKTFVAEVPYSLNFPHLYYAAAACFVHTQSSLIICGSPAQYTQAWKDFCPNLYSTNYSIDCTYTSSQELILNPFLYTYCTTVCIISQHAHSMYTVPQNVLYNKQYVHHTTYVQYACIIIRILYHCMYTDPLYVRMYTIDSVAVRLT